VKVCNFNHFIFCGILVLLLSLLIQGVPFKMQPNNNHVQDSPSLPLTFKSRSPWLLGRSSRQLRKICADANMVYSRGERVFTPEHYLASKSFAAVREAFSNACPDKEVLNETTIHRLITKFRDTGSVCVCLRRWWISAVKLLCKFFLTNKSKKINSFFLLYWCHHSSQILL
jgi:hypothetical protein